MGALEEQLLNTNVVLMAAGAWFVLWVLRKIWKGMDNIEWVKKFKPVYPALLCQGFVWIPGAMPTEPEPTIGTRILMGLWCGFLASIGYQLLKRFLSRRGVVDLPENPDDLIPKSDKEEDKPKDDTDPEATKPDEPEEEEPDDEASEEEGEAGGADEGEDSDGEKPGSDAA
jgi:hypothetical protein